MLAGYSGQTLKLLQSSWTQGTVKQYKTYLHRWEEYCSKKGINTVDAPVAAGVEFLLDFIKQTCNTQHLILPDWLCLQLFLRRMASPLESSPL